MFRKIIVLLVVFLLAACAPAVDHVTITSQVTVTSFPAATPTALASPTVSPESLGYWDEIMASSHETDSILEGFVYKGVDLDATIRLHDTLSNRADKIGMTDKRLADTALRLLRSIFQPDNKGDEAGLDAFGKQLGELKSCADGPSATFKIFSATENGAKEEMTLVPDCGGVGVPAGAFEVKKTTLVYGDFTDLDPNIGSVVSPDATWISLVTSTGFGTGAMFNKQTGELIVTMSVWDIRGSTTLAQDLGITTELSIDWLASVAKGGRGLSNLKNLQKWFDRAETWFDEIVITR